MRKRLDTFVLVLLLSSMVNFGFYFQKVKADESFIDNFDDQVSSNWTLHLGSWQENSGAYHVSVPNIETGLSTLNGLNSSDGVIETKIRFSDAVNFKAGIAFRYLDSQHFYTFEISHEYNWCGVMIYTPQSSFFGVDLVAKPSGTFPVQLYTDYILKVVMQGDSFTCFVNGQQLLSLTDSRYKTGLVGLKATRSEASFDYFKVENATNLPPNETNLPSPVPPRNPLVYPNESYAEDFSTDSGTWQYFGSAYRSQTNQQLVLTSASVDQTGIAFFNAPIQGSFIANFSYKIGGGNSNLKNDGLILFFYKQKYPSTIDYAESYGDNGIAGGRLGFNSGSIVPGYGIEFDGWHNIAYEFADIAGGQPNPQEDPSGNHIALLKDFTGDHLVYVNDQRIADNVWHRVSVEVQGSSIKVFVDQGLVLQWSGELNRTFDGFGFSGSNGMIGGNWHIIDDFSISAHGLKQPSLYASAMSSEYESSFKVNINGNLTFNGTGMSGAPILLSYSITGGQSWQDLTFVYTGSDGSYSAKWLPSVTGNYQLKAVYKGGEDYLGTVNIVNFAMEPYAEQSVFSVTSNSTISELSFNSASAELSFSVSGENGTIGYVNVCIPKSLIGDISSLKLFLDSNQIDYTAKSESDSWLLYFTYHHSSHLVTISLKSSFSPHISPAASLQPTLEATQTPASTANDSQTLDLTPIILAAVVVAAVAAGALVYFKRRKGTL